MPPTSNGKADGVSILDGSNIPSQHVDPTKRYLTGRAIAPLRDIGALSGVPESVAVRADGIIANLPANGRIEAAELVRMEDPAIFATLFSDEQAALPDLWPHLVAPVAGGAIQVPSPAGDLTVTEQLTEPGGLALPPSLLISSLPSELQTVARRVQLVFDGDGDAATIETADIDKVLANPAAFTPAELEQLRRIVAIFHERATSSPDATAIVPAPGHSETATNIGALTLTLEADVVLHETRTVRTVQTAMDWGGELKLEQKLAAMVSGGATDKAIFIRLGTETEHVVEMTGSVPALAAGTYIVERYAGGQREATHEVVMPSFTPGETASNISQFLDYTLVLANNTPLVKNPISTLVEPNGSTGTNMTAEFHFATSTMTAPNINASVLESVATPPLSLPVGRYEVRFPRNGGVYTIDLFPQNVVIARHESIRSRLLFTTAGYPTRKAFKGSLANSVLHFVPETSQVYVSWIGFIDDVTVTAAMRVQ